MDQEQLEQQIELDNGQLLEIYNASRKIAADTWLVKCIFRTEVTVSRDLFAEEDLLKFSFQEIHDAVGETAVFEKEHERNFVNENDKDALLTSMMDGYMDGIGKYIASPTFPKKLVIRKFIENRPGIRR